MSDGLTVLDLLLAAGWEDTDENRRSRYLEARRFWDGEQWEGRVRRGESRLTFNYARALVRKAVSYMLSAPVTFNVIGVEQPYLGRAESCLSDTLSQLDADQLDFALAEQMSVIGDSAVKVTWDEDGQAVRLAAVHPAELAVRWRAGDTGRPTWVRHSYRMEGWEIADAWGVLGLNADKSYGVVETWSDEGWRVEVDKERLVYEGPNPYGWIPYVVLANNPGPQSFWGSSDLTDLYDVCRQLNRRLSVVADILDLAGYPIAVLENVDSTEGISVGPGARWELPEGARAYLLDLLSSGGVGLHVQYIEQVRTTLHDLAETPRTSFGDSGRPLSGVALEVEIQPLVQRVRRKRRAFERFYRQRNERILSLLEDRGGWDLGGARRTAPMWPPILPSDDEAAVRIETQLVGAGLRSRRTAIAGLGSDDPEAELDRILEEARSALGGMADVGPVNGAAAGTANAHGGGVQG